MKEEKHALDLETRRRIYQIIKESPGLHFRELLRRTGFATGALQYHLDYMKKRELLLEDREAGHSRFYVVGELAEDEITVMRFLRQASIRRILLFLIDNPNSGYEAICAETGHSPSTVSWHVKRLSEAGVVTKSQEGQKVGFRVANANLLLKLLISYKQSFLDKALDRFIDSWAHEKRDTKEIPKQPYGKGPEK